MYTNSDYTEATRELTRIGRELANKALVAASGGNLSARLGDSEHCVITGTGSWLEALSPADFVVLDTRDGRTVEGERAPSSEYKVHTMTYAARHDVSAVVHCHPQWTVLSRALGIEIRPLSLDHFSYLGEIRYVPFSANGSDQLGIDVAAAASSGSDVIVLDHHGSVCLGRDLAMGYRRSLNLEEAARASYYTALSGHEPLVFPTAKAHG